MKKKVSFWMYAVAGAILVIAGIWGFWPEYGSGYSEDQRRSWNEGMARTEGDISAHMDMFYNETTSESASVLRRRQAQPDAPEWKLDFHDSPVDLPLEGMSVATLTHLADNGDGDACLELVFRSFRGAPTIRLLDTVFQSEKYLKRAVALERPGADFLLRFLEEWKKRGNDVEEKDVEGYQAFLSYLNDGDFLLGKVYIHLNPRGASASGLDQLEAGLVRKSAEGDVAALRNRGYLELLKVARGEGPVWIRSFFYRSEENCVSWWSDCILKWIWKSAACLPAPIKPESRTIIKINRKSDRFVSAWRLKRARRELKKPLELLIDAAERGDIQAKFLWTQYSVWSGMKFSRKEWETHLRYADELLKAGGCYAEARVCSLSFPSFPLESFFYKEESQKRVICLMEKRQEERYKDLFTNRVDALSDISILRMEMKAKYNMETFVNDYMKDILEKPADKTDGLMKGLELMERAAEEGNPFALYGFVRMLNEGMIMEPDAGKAWELLQRLKTWREGIHEEFLSGMVVVSIKRDGNVTTSISGCDLDGAVVYLTLDVVARHGDMPGMTVKQAFDQFVREHIEEWSSMNSEVLDRLSEQFEKRGYKVSDENEK